MDIKLINKQLKLAIKSESVMHSACGAIASNLQPYFDCDISVFNQRGEGFVVLWDAEDGNVPNNDRVEDVVERIAKSPDHYRIS